MERLHQYKDTKGVYFMSPSRRQGYFIEVMKRIDTGSSL